MPILLKYCFIFAAEIVPISQLKLNFMDRPDAFIKGSLRLTISNGSNSVDVLIPYDSSHLFMQVACALMCGNDVIISHSFVENQI